MPAKKDDVRKKYVIPAVAVIAVALVVYLSNRPSTTSNGLPIVQGDADYDNALAKVKDSTQTAVGKFNVGVELEQADKDAALNGAKTFDLMNAYRPNMSAGYFEAGLLYYLSGNSDTALDRLKQSLADANLPANIKKAGDKEKLLDVLANVHHIVSLIAFDKHEYKAAAEEATTALTIVPKRESFFFARAQAEVQLNKIAEAKKDLTEALALNPGYLPAGRLDDFLKR